jgi:hypothetical protein
MRRSLSLLGAVAIGASLVAFRSEGRPSPKAGDPLAQLARLPLTFEPNQGQFDAGVRFVARAPGQSVALTDEGLTISPAGVRVTLAGVRTPSGGVVGEQPLPGVVSRIIGNDPAQWRSSIPTFGAVAYRDAYPGIDVVFHGAGRDVEHDFVVSPGADPAVIALAVTGTGSGGAHLDRRGDLIAGDVRLRAPVLYQEGDGGREPVRGRYQIRPDGSFGFAVGAYDRSRPLVIDPVLVSSSYLGGSSTDTAYGVATDADGNVVVTGYTESSDFPTVNPAQAGRPGAEGTRRDIFVTKVKADCCGRPIWGAGARTRRSPSPWARTAPSMSPATSSRPTSPPSSPSKAPTGAAPTPSWSSSTPPDRRSNTPPTSAAPGRTAVAVSRWTTRARRMWSAPPDRPTSPRPSRSRRRSPERTTRTGSP